MNGVDLRFQIQDEAYAFPYHYLPQLDGGAVGVGRVLGWGMEYLTYMHFVREAVTALRPTRVLDVGCGDGRMLQLLRGVVPERVGVDPSEKAIRFARAFNPDAECVAGTADDVPGTFDVVTCVETLEHIPDAQVEPFVRSLAARLAPGGALVVSVPSTARPVHPKHHRHYTAELLAAQLAPWFRAEEVRHVFDPGLRTRLLTRLLSNRLWTVNAAPVRRWVWRRHVRSGFYAPEGRGAHVVGVFRRTEHSG